MPWGAAALFEARAKEMLRDAGIGELPGRNESATKDLIKLSGHDTELRKSPVEISGRHGAAAGAKHETEIRTLATRKSSLSPLRETRRVPTTSGSMYGHARKQALT